MVETNSNNGDAGNIVDVIFADVCQGGEQANGAIPTSGREWHERSADRSRFRRYETSRKQSAKRNDRRIVIDGVIRYADKPFFCDGPCKACENSPLRSMKL